MPFSDKSLTRVSLKVLFLISSERKHCIYKHQRYVSAKRFIDTFCSLTSQLISHYSFKLFLFLQLATLRTNMYIRKNGEGSQEMKSRRKKNVTNKFFYTFQKMSVQFYKLGKVRIGFFSSYYLITYRAVKIYVL